ncbi:MAG TPA: hypothetical protein VMV57_14645 [Terracidiphilus sp.]|nr:hypothetical protein [Terracidiphilus sp.]
MRRKQIALVTGICLLMLGGVLHAQATRTFTVRVLDGKTGKILAPSNLMVRVDKQPPIHADWVRQNEDATALVTLPASAKWVSVEAAYDESMEIYMHCDVAPEDYPGERLWYSVAKILASGVAATDGCAKPEKADAWKPVAKPGVLIFFVRERKHGDPAGD